MRFGRGDGVGFGQGRQKLALCALAYKPRLCDRLPTFPPPSSADVRSWADVGGLDEVKRRLRQAVEWPLQHAAAFERLGLTAPRGVLLHGPPGEWSQGVEPMLTLVRIAVEGNASRARSSRGAPTPAPTIHPPACPHHPGWADEYSW